jgi:zinc transport system ATP-binding protein
MSRILKVSNLTVAFDDRIIINDLSFELERGEILAVIGPNGSGKTVLLKTLLGIIPFQQGKVEWAENVKLGYVPQKIDADRHLPLNVGNLLAAKAKVAGLDKKEIEKVARNLNLSRELLRAPIGHLSGGQFQKALIAFALLGNPRVILFDEPTASLDQLSEEHIYESIHDLQEKHGVTVILVSHELSVVYRYATKVLCLNKEKVCFGQPEEALTTEVLRELYGSPHKLHSRHAHNHHGHAH